MNLKKLLIANRGEIAVRIARAAAELGIPTVSVYSEDDAASLHCRRTDESRVLRGTGAAAYLDIEQIVAAAKASGCNAIHPGYGFLSENAVFATRCAEEGIIFAGPQPEVLQLFGDKVQARALAQKNGIPVIAGTAHPTSVEEASAFLASLPPGSAMMIKAVAGGGGRGMRTVHRAEDVADAYARCQSEAKAAFGCADVYVEQLLPKARHIEVQMIGDGSGSVVHLWERECTLQRRNQKLFEVAPSPTLPHSLRQRIIDAAVLLAQSVRYRSLGTFEFLVDASDHTERAAFYFMEANPRLQVEHTVTEEVTGIDLVKAQLQLATGCTLAQAGLTQHEIPMPRGFAVQLRINMETMDSQGNAQPSGGTLSVFEPPSGPGIRVDSYGYAGYTTNPNFDSLLAKLIATTPSGHYPDLLVRAYRALCEFRIEGIDTNIGQLQNLLTRPDVVANRVHTRFVEDHIQALIEPVDGAHQKLYIPSSPAARAVIDLDPRHPAPEGAVPVEAPMQGSVVSIDVMEGDVVQAGRQIAVIEAMKMEHVVKAEQGGIVCKVNAAKGEVLFRGHPLVYIEPADVDAAQAEQEESTDPDAIRPDLAEAMQRHAIGLDAARPDAVARRRKTGQRTARENIADLCDTDSFIEYGALALAAQRRRRSIEELVQISPADGLVAGVGSVNGALFDDSKSRCMVMSYDYTVFAGTQGMMNHKKTDRMFQLADQWRLPVVIFAEGGGGRPGDTDAMLVAGLDVMSFINFAKLSGLAPRVGIVSGRCFAGNAAFLGCCDVIIATENATIGMGGPAMIEGGGLGVFAPEEVGPVSVQAPNGVIDIVVKDEAEAVAATKKYLSYFQGPLAQWECADQRDLRRLIPENRLRSYDIRTVIDMLADKDSVLELRHSFGVGIITALVRIEGRPFGLIANNPMHLGGAIDADAADKAARFMQLCDAFDLPILSLCDTPGFMVGPDAERTAMVRHVSRMFVVAGSISVPFFTIVLRKGYGLGAQAMAGGSFHAPFSIVSWPSGEFGAMGLEGAVRLGYRKELEAVEDPAERKALFEKMVAESYENGKAINMASFLEIDAVIDPMSSRQWLMRALRSTPPALQRDRKKRPCIDTW
ncbi:carbamoyl-phosphate synthase large subunit [Herbaspirillum sp. HC18]|nr:carbamoyl-phosphate synthase large subunit [Herbaspirillum sp. HC18]